MTNGRWLRFTLAAIYAATLLGADLAHQHQRHADEPRAECLASCAAVGLHLTSHPAPDLSVAHAECHACLLHSAPALLPQSSGFHHSRLAARLAPPPCISSTKPPHFVPLGRGPPPRSTTPRVV